jgi:hypothetical protein
LGGAGVRPRLTNSSLHDSLANESASPSEGDHKGSPLPCYGCASRCVHGGKTRQRATTRVAPTILRLRKPVRAWRQRNVSFPSHGHFTLCVIRQQSRSCWGGGNVRLLRSPVISPIVGNNQGFHFFLVGNFLGRRLYLVPGCHRSIDPRC